MKFFSQVFPSDYCFLNEAAFWVAFGRLPEFELVEDGVDFRRSKELILQGEVDDRCIFIEEYFKSAGMDIEYESYSKWLLGDPGYNSLDEFDEMRHKFSLMFGDAMEGIDQFNDESRSRVEKIENWETPLHFLLDKSRISLLPYLMDGRIACEGWVELWSEDGEQVVGGDFQPIPATAWRPFNMNWEENSLQARDCEYKAIQAKTADLLHYFPSPPTVSKEASGVLFGNLFIADVATDSTDQPLRKKGRPSKTYDVGTVLQNVFMAKLKSGSLGDQKEAIVQEAIEWAKKMMGQDIARSTAQRHLLPVLELLPKSGARKS